MTDLPTLAESIPHQLATNAMEYPDVDAVVAPDGRVDYAGLHQLVDELVEMLLATGVRQQDRVGILLPNGLRWVVSALAVESLGAIAVPVSTWSKRTELERFARQTHPKLLITTDNILGKDPRPLLGECGFPLDIGNAYAPYIGTVVWPTADRLPSLLGANASGADRRSVASDMCALYISTSGSTSEPKVVPLLHRSLLQNGRAIGERQGIVPGDRIWLGAPLFFSYGCANALPMALAHAATLILQEGVDGNEALSLIERERCTVYYGFGPTTRKLTEASEFGTHDVSSLRTGTTGFSAEEKFIAREVLGVQHICSVYGMTEAYGHSVMTSHADDDDTFFETQGRVLPTQELRIVDPETNRPLPENESGEIQLRGAVTPGYVERIHDAFTPDGWFRTGDIGYLDAADRLVFVDRIKSLLKINGINVAPAEIEAVIAEHVDVEQVFVFGDYVDGAQCAVAAIVPTADSNWEELTESLVSFVKNRAASYKVPARFVRLTHEEVPLTDTGKINKRMLAEQLRGVRN